ncbi:hypothetical protein D1872_36200 [compost metagenome]
MQSKNDKTFEITHSIGTPIEDVDNVYNIIENARDHINDNTKHFTSNEKEVFTNTVARLNTTDRVPLSLKPGVNIVDMPKQSTYIPNGLRGFTRVNLLGLQGRFDIDINNDGISDGWDPNTGLFSAANITSKGTNGCKAQYGKRKALNDVSITRTVPDKFPMDANKYLLFICDVKVETGSLMTHIQAYDSSHNSLIMEYSAKTSLQQYKPVVVKLKTPANTSNFLVSLDGNAVGDSGWFSSARVYELSATEYNELSGMTDSQIAEKYPYMDTVQGITNPYIYNRGVNLLPPLGMWTYFQSGIEWQGDLTRNKITSSYDMTMPKLDSSITSNNQGIIYDMRVYPNTTYTFTIDKMNSTGYLRIEYFQYITTERLAPNFSKPREFSNVRNGTFTFTTPNGCNSIRVCLGTQSAENSFDNIDLRFVNPMLVVGSNEYPFQEMNTSLFSLNTTLMANPVDQSYPDTVVYENGQYIKRAVWRSTTLTGTEGTSCGVHAGFDTPTKIIYVKFVFADRIRTVYPIMIKPNGSILRAGFPTSDLMSISKSVWDGTNTHPDFDQTSFAFSVDQWDSGWGNNYTPNEMEIRAYLNGWRMYLAGQGDVSKPYNNEAAGKAWCPIDSVSNSGTGWKATMFVSTVPTTIITSLNYTRTSTWKPHMVISPVKTPRYEPITHDGAIKFNEGRNLVEIGSDIIVKERVYPKLATNYDIGTTYAPVIYNIDKIMYVYRNGIKDPWTIWSSDDNSQGMESGGRGPGSYDIMSSYSMTYIKQAKSMKGAFEGYYTNNENTLLDTLTDDRAKLTSRVTYLENSLINQDFIIDVPLYSGFTNYKNITNTFDTKLVKRGNIIHVFISITKTSGSFGDGEVIGFLPPELRPLFSFNDVFMFSHAPDVNSSDRDYETFARITFYQYGAITVFMHGTNVPQAVNRIHGRTSYII